MRGYVHSLQSLGAVDGPGVRAVVFGEGCPLRCAYCHNPDTWETKDEDKIEAEALCERILRLYPYIKNGGVTFSGGEPCLQAPFFAEVAGCLKAKGLHVALDTCGEVQSPAVDELLSYVDLILLDVKMTTEEDYARYTGGRLARAIGFLEKAEKRQIPVWVRQVIVPAINDTEENIDRLAALLSPFSCVEKVELLPFRTLCVEKYKSLGIPFPLADTPDMTKERIAPLQERINQALGK